MSPRIARYQIVSLIAAILFLCPPALAADPPPPPIDVPLTAAKDPQQTLQVDPIWIAHGELLLNIKPPGPVTVSFAVPLSPQSEDRVGTCDLAESKPLRITATGPCRALSRCLFSTQGCHLRIESGGTGKIMTAELKLEKLTPTRTETGEVQPGTFALGNDGTWHEANKQEIDEARKNGPVVALRRVGSTVEAVRYDKVSCKELPTLTRAELISWCTSKYPSFAPESLVLCVDASHPSAPDECLLETAATGKFVCRDFTALPPNHNLDVRVVHSSLQSVEIDPGGSVGSVSVIYAPPSGTNKLEGKTAAPCEDELKISRQEFAPRTNEFIDLKFTLTKDGGKTIITKPIRIRRDYRFALRTGIGVSYSPLDRTYEARSSGNANNPGKEIAVKAGDGAGIWNAELMLGVSWFTVAVDSNDYGPVFSVFAGLGVLSGNAKGVDAFSSLVVGPELSLGKDFSFALIAGIRRTQTLEGDLKVGMPVPAGETDVPTVFSVTPTFGLMVNLSPYVFSVAGQR